MIINAFVDFNTDRFYFCSHKKTLFISYDLCLKDSFPTHNISRIQHNVTSNTKYIYFLIMFQNSSGSQNNATIMSSNIGHPDFDMYRMVYGLTIAVILVGNIIRGFAFTTVSLFV